jgi:hypothetical protein
MYLYQGLTGGANKFLSALEKRQEEEKNNAKEYKALQQMAESMGIMNKDQTTVMDLDSLRGAVQGNIWKAQNDRINQQSQMQQMEALRKYASDANMAGFANSFNNAQALDPGLADYYENPEAHTAGRPDSTMASFSSALGQFPGAAADERFSGFMGAVERMRPDVAKSGTLAGDIDFLSKRFGTPEPALKAMAENFMANRGSSGKRSTVVHPDGRVEIIEGDSGGATTATQSDAQQTIKDTRKLMDNIDDLTENLRWQDIGTPGVFGEHVLDRFLPMVGVGKPDPKRTDNRTKLRMFIQGAMRTISTDQRFTEPDRKRIEAVMPSDGWVENEERAKTVLNTIQRVFAKRNIIDMQAMGKKITLGDLNDSEIGGAMEMGLFSEEEALAELTRRISASDRKVKRF